jgi:hypothetical protein
MITEWFEDENFVAAVIMLGLNAVSAKGATNVVGMVDYNMEKQFVPDGKAIALAVTMYNKMESAQPNGSHELAKHMLEHDDGRLQCSVDISTCEEDSDRRAFGDFTDINYSPSDEGFGSDHTMLLFEGSIND